VTCRVLTLRRYFVVWTSLSWSSSFVCQRDVTTHWHCGVEAASSSTTLDVSTSSRRTALRTWVRVIHYSSTLPLHVPCTFYWTLTIGSFHFLD